VACAVTETEPPGQIEVGVSAVTAGLARSGSRVVETGSEARLQPFPSVTVTVNEPDVVTSMVWVVAPLDQRYE